MIKNQSPYPLLQGGIRPSVFQLSTSYFRFSTHYRISILSHYQITVLSNYRIIKLPHYQITALSHSHIIQLFLFSCVHVFQKLFQSHFVAHSHLSGFTTFKGAYYTRSLQLVYNTPSSVVTQF